MDNLNLNHRFWLPIIGFCLVFATGTALGQQFCKYDSIPATAPASRFTDNGDGTVTDIMTNLQWKRCSEGQTWDGITCVGHPITLIWKDALQLADSASYAGKSDWRVPNLKELISISEKACREPAINLEIFPNSSGTPWQWWTSSPYVDLYEFEVDNAYAWEVDFWWSFINRWYKDGTNYNAANNRGVRLVRDGKNGRLNDTGITWWADGNTNFLSTEPIEYIGQDASYGRDVTHNDNSDGHAGFSFTKLGETGNPLPASAPSWSCVRDNVTGLIWEVKTDDGSLRDKDWAYSWYNPDSTTNGGSAGTRNTGSCSSSACDTDSFVSDINAAGLCGASDWRLPGLEELRSIIDYSRLNPSIDASWFGLTNSHLYWSSSPSIYASYAWTLNFYGGLDGQTYKSDAFHVRLVRGKPAFGFDPYYITPRAI